MCGIAGCANIADDGLRNALDALAHRGPDASGEWRGEAVALGHRRLSVIDLSPEANQPFVNEDGSVRLVANGEIYNFRELREELLEAGHVFKSRSDSEVLLHGYEEWGIEKLLGRINGMFAFTIHDSKINRLFCARDRMGIKPLYYHYAGGAGFAFASELPALLALLPERPSLNTAARDAFFTFGYIPGDLTIRETCFKLLPGHFSSFDLANSVWNVKKYWHPEIPEPRVERSVEEVEEIIRGSIVKRLVSDRPIGTFLSGGIDSSLVTALAAAEKSDIATFSIGFEFAEFDESEYAAEIARHLGTKHTRLFCTEKDALEIVPELPAVFGEPFADPSAIPTYLLSRMTRENVVVALSGDGGDELTLGYGQYPKIVKLRRLLSIPGVKPLLKSISGIAPVASLPAKLALAAKCGGIDELTLLASSIYRLKYREKLFNGDYKVSGTYWSELAARTGKLPIDEALAFIEMNHYMTEDILTKVDRCSMRHALEVRTPLLDHEVVETLIALPKRMKTANGETKWILREILKRHVPESLWKRPKQGFGPPLGEWLRGPLREMAEDALSADSLARESVFNVDFVRRLLDEHETGTADHTEILWTLIQWTANTSR
ncbi:MAG: asparagine synthase (glutamine-hydrolyzing) [Kiritimatiellaeota bacterium]|nr:asparagine synthase (glutamine-hydrolyzing) [Kiritimatiellota bacterium]